MLKKIGFVILSVVMCIVMASVAFARNDFVVDDNEAKYDPVKQTTAPVVETTTSLRDSIGDIIDKDKVDKYVSGFTGSLSESLGSLGGLLGNVGSFDWQQGTTQPGQTTTQLPTMPSSTSPGYTSAITTSPETTVPENTTAESTVAVFDPNENEVHSILVVNNTADGSGISGSTLTIIVFVAAILLLILVVAIVLVAMTRRTEFDSAVKRKSTIPQVDRPGTLSIFTDDDDDGQKLDNITYWD